MVVVVVRLFCRRPFQGPYGAPGWAALRAGLKMSQKMTPFHTTERRAKGKILSSHLGEYLPKLLFFLGGGREVRCILNYAPLATLPGQFRRLFKNSPTPPTRPHNYQKKGANFGSEMSYPTDATWSFKRLSRKKQTKLSAVCDRFLSTTC